jgi:hypothetical protein
MSILIPASTGYLSVIQWIEHHLLSCPSKKFLHLECPGCGMQRSLLALLKGDFIESIRMYPALLLLIFLVIFTFLHLRFDFKIGASLIKWNQFFAGIIILAFYFYKLITHKTCI